MRALVQAIRRRRTISGIWLRPGGFRHNQGLIASRPCAVDYTSDEAKRRFEIMARRVFIRFKATMEPSAPYALRHTTLRPSIKSWRSATADVAEVLRVRQNVNEAIPVGAWHRSRRGLTA